MNLVRTTLTILLAAATFSGSALADEYTFEEWDAMSDSEAIVAYCFGDASPTLTAGQCIPGTENYGYPLQDICIVLEPIPGHEYLQWTANFCNGL